MTIGDYSLDDIATILEAFEIPAKPYTQCQGRTVDIYFAKLASINKFNLLNDTLSYIQEALRFQKKPTATRRVCFIFKTEAGLFAIIAHYKNFNEKRLQSLTSTCTPGIPLLSQGRSAAEWQEFQTIYDELILDCLIPANQESYLLTFLKETSHYSGRLTHHFHIIPENTGVTLTAWILMFLFLGEKQELASLEKTSQSHRDCCLTQLAKWLATLKQQNVATYQQITRNLEINIKYKLILAAHNQEEIQHILSQNMDNVPTLLNLLTQGFISCMLQLRQNPILLSNTLVTHNNKLQQQILERIQQNLSSQHVSWKDWIYQQGTHAASYLYQQSYAAIGSTMIPWLYKFFYKPPTNTLSTLLSCSGFTLGLIYMIYLGAFEIALSYAILLLTEAMYYLINNEIIDITNARIISAERFFPIPSKSTLLQINAFMIFAILHLYTQEFYYLARGAIAVATSLLFKTLFHRYKDKIADITPDDIRHLEFIFSYSGMSTGTLLCNIPFQFFVCVAARAGAFKTFQEDIKEHDPTINYIRADLPDIASNIYSLFGGSNSIKLTWGNNIQTFQTDCTIVSDFYGRVGNVVCDAPRELPLMLRAK